MSSWSFSTLPKAPERGWRTPGRIPKPGPPILDSNIPVMYCRLRYSKVDLLLWEPQELPLLGSYIPSYSYSTRGGSTFWRFILMSLSK